jgi:L-ascorbate metabolism protein UlaG (beta-lactamase superfamily)
MRKRYKALLGVLVILSIGGTMVNQSLISEGSLNNAQLEQSPQFNGEQFQNPIAISTVGAKDYWIIIKAYIFDKQEPAKPKKPIEVLDIDPKNLAQLDRNEMVFYRLGHSTLLIWLDGEFWLTDPVFSERASPFEFTGPKRFHRPPISLDNLPPIKGVILSHNHYDHLDKEAIKKLTEKVEHFYIPIGLGGDLHKWGVAKEKISEFDWWQSIQVGSVQLTATPSQHFSGRGLTDGNKSLWASWVIKGEQANLFFSGDSGYFEGLKTIGEELGPFDFSFMETGAYNSLWADVHMMPGQAVQAHLDVRADVMVPIHNGTFDLSLHTWTDPFEQIEKFSFEKNVRWLTPQMGEKVTLGKEVTLNKWWATN